MYYDRLVKAYKNSGLTKKKIALESNVSEKTISRMLESRDYHASVDVLESVVPVLGITMQELFCDTDAVVVSREMIDGIEEAKSALEQNKQYADEIVALKERIFALTTENISLRTELEHKQEVINLHESYKSILNGFARIITETSTDTQ